jgi:hypothetical protein
MKNIHILPTDKPTRLFTFESELTLSWYSKNTFKTGKNIYITSDEDINENDYIITKDGRLVQVSYLLSKDLEGASKVILTTDQELIKDGVQAIDDEFLEWFVKNPNCEKVETSFLCRGIDGLKGAIGEYKIFIPKEKTKNICIQTGLPCGMQCLSEETCNMIKPKQELSKDVVLGYKTSLVAQMLDKIEPKQETIQEAAERYTKEEIGLGFYPDIEIAFEKGAKWQQEKSYSEEEVKFQTNKLLNDLLYKKGFSTNVIGGIVNEWFEQFKKK